MHSFSDCHSYSKYLDSKYTFTKDYLVLNRPDTHYSVECFDKVVFVWNFEDIYVLHNSFHCTGNLQNTAEILFTI